MPTFMAVLTITYNNPDQNKDLVIKENRNKSVIYSWIHIEFNNN